MTEESKASNVRISDRHCFIGKRTLFHIIADRDAFIGASDDWVDGKEVRFLGFTREDWTYAGAPKHYLGYNHRCPHPDLLIFCGMAGVVEHWRREAASQYEGEHGPVPAFWDMPDLEAQWKLANPDIVAAREAQEGKRVRERNEKDEFWERVTARRDDKEASGS